MASVVLSSDGFHIESHIDEVPALARVKDLHGGLSSGQQALGRIVQALLADADGLSTGHSCLTWRGWLSRIVMRSLPRRMLPLTLRGAKTNGQ